MNNSNTCPLVATSHWVWQQQSTKTYYIRKFWSLYWVPAIPARPTHQIGGKDLFVWIAKPIQNLLHLLSMWSNLWAQQIPSNYKFAEEYVENNKWNKYLIFIFLAYPIPNLDYVSHTRINCVFIAKPFKYLNYEEDYVSTAYLTTYLDFVAATQSMSSQWVNQCGHHKS